MDFDFPLKRPELWVAGHEFSLIFFGQGGGESIGQTQLETCFEIGGSVGQGAGCGMKIDGVCSPGLAVFENWVLSPCAIPRLGNRETWGTQDLGGFRPGGGAVFFHNRVLHLGVGRETGLPSPSCALNNARK